VHTYLVTAKPNWRQRMLRRAGHYTARTLITAAMLLLGLVVFTLRACRALTSLAATVAARAEYAAADWAGTIPVGAVLGHGIAEAFTEEFNDAYQAAA
jgi:predicted nicotinamide N-methyase